MIPEIVFLGTSAGIPTADRGLPSFSLIYKGKVYLFDVGEGTQRQMMRFNVRYFKTESVFITHLHTDHFLGLLGLVETLHLLDRRSVLNVYGPPGLKDLVFVRHDFLDITEFDRVRKVRFNGFYVKPFRVKHIPNSYGYVIQFDDRIKFDGYRARSLGIRGQMFRELIEKGKIRVGRRTVYLEDVSSVKKGLKIVYSGDTRPCASVVNAAKGADLLIHEASFLESESELAKERRHSTALEAAEVAKKAGVRKLILTHISQRYKDLNIVEKEAKKVFRNTLCAYDGMRITLRP